eukprot:6193917-Pleurochrysis_carterae.AAC.1
MHGYFLCAYVNQTYSLTLHRSTVIGVLKDNSELFFMRDESGLSRSCITKSSHHTNSNCRWCCGGGLQLVTRYPCSIATRTQRRSTSKQWGKGTHKSRSYKGCDLDLKWQLYH